MELLKRKADTMGGSMSRMAPEQERCLASAARRRIIRVASSLEVSSSQSLMRHR